MEYTLIVGLERSGTGSEHVIDREYRKINFTSQTRSQEGLVIPLRDPRSD